MCGIAGILGDIEPADRARVENMARIMRHRGPDGLRTQIYDYAALGFVRLAIIDLDDRAMQPMSTTDGRLTIVFNGEIYNYLELRRQLQPHFDFRTEGDTEVLLAAYQHWGRDCLKHLNGMFAFCIYDTQARSAFFARDRFGQKPLHFATVNGRLLFGSEIKALIAGGYRPQPNMETWARYLTAASYDDDETTFFAGVDQLQPGECAIWTPASGLTRSTYYELRDHIQVRDIGVDQARAETRDLLIDAARLHMRSDVPVAVALSGGLDSSALLACLDLSGDIAGVNCFSVEFENELSERHWIEAAAAHHGLNSHIEVCRAPEIADNFAGLIWFSEGPLGGVMNNALLRVMSAASNQGFKVIQDGTGLDEAFAGYLNHHNLYLGQKIREKSSGWRQALTEYARNWDVTEARAEAAALAELENDGTTIDGTVPVRPDLLKADFVAQHGRQIAWPDATGGHLRNSLIDYLQVRKIPRNTRMKDRLSMAFGLELRLPFLDHRLVEHALSLPEEMYFLHGRSKSIVREALAGDMDEEVRIATKRSIQAPQGKWLIAEPLANYVRDIITSRSFADRGFFETKAVHEAFDEFCLGNTPNSFFVWQWINMENWYRTFIDNDPLTNRHPLVASATQ